MKDKTSYWRLWEPQGQSSFRGTLLNYFGLGHETTQCPHCHRYTRGEQVEPWRVRLRTVSGKQWGDFVWLDAFLFICKKTFMESLAQEYPGLYAWKEVSFEETGNDQHMFDYVQPIIKEHIPLNKEKMQKFLLDECAHCGSIIYDWMHPGYTTYLSRLPVSPLFQIDSDAATHVTEKGKELLATLNPSSYTLQPEELL